MKCSWRLLVAALAAVEFQQGAFSQVYSAKHIFTDEEIAACTRFRTPTLVRNPETGAIHLTTRCCGKNRCSGKTRDQSTGVETLRDNLKDCKVAMKTTLDNGRTWSKLQYISGDSKGFGHGSAVWDRINRRIVLQYQSYPHGQTSPTADTTYFQVYSSDDARTWTAPENITHFLTGCNRYGRDHMMDLTAGNKIQTPAGRLLFTAHNHNHEVCAWYSDDGGKTYNVSNIVRGNEISVATLSKKGHLYMNGRGQSFPQWKGHRVDYFSYDDGATWTDPVKSPLLTDYPDNCERAVTSFNNVLYTSEPQGYSRTHMVVQCSTNDAVSWNRNVSVNGAHRAGYSDLLGLPNGNLFMVWEDDNNRNGNVWVAEIDTKWCSGNPR